MVQRKPKRPPARKRVVKKAATKAKPKATPKTKAKPKAAPKTKAKPKPKLKAASSSVVLSFSTAPTRKKTGVHHFAVDSKGRIREVKAPPRTARPLPAPSGPREPPKPSKTELARAKAEAKAAAEAEALRLEAFQRSLGLPQEYEPRRPPSRLKPPVKRVLKPEEPSWDRARKLAGGTWMALALALHTTTAELRMWRQNEHPTGVGRRDQFIAEQEREQRVSAEDVETFNRLLAEAKREQFSPDYATSQGRKEGPHTVGYYWTRNYNRAPTPAMIDDVRRWLQGLRGKPGCDLWHATGEVYQFGGQGFRRGYKQQSLVTVIPQSVDPEAADFSRAVIANVPALHDKEQVIERMCEELEMYQEESRQTLVLWVTMRNYRKKVASEISDYWHEKYEAGKKAKVEREQTAMDRFKMSLGLQKTPKKRGKKR